MAGSYDGSIRIDTQINSHAMRRFIFFRERIFPKKPPMN